MLTAASASGHEASSGVELDLSKREGAGVCPGGSIREWISMSVASRCNPMITSIQGDLPSSQQTVTNRIYPAIFRLPVRDPVRHVPGSST